jgi:hypothetical protein
MIFHIWAHFLLCKKPGFPLQFLENTGGVSAGFPLQSLTRQHLRLAGGGCDPEAQPHCACAAGTLVINFESMPF